MRLKDRLEQLKAELKPVIQSRMIFLLNPKDIKPLESVVAWSALPKTDLSDVEVSENASMDELWKKANPDIFAFATALGCKMSDATSRLEQLKQLDIIYPDGSVSELAMSIVNVYIKNRVSEIRGKDE